MEFIDVLRGLTIFMTVMVMMLFCFRYGRAFQSMKSGPRLYFGGVIFILITVSWDTLILIMNDVGFSWRILPLLLGLTCSLIYLLEPFTKRGEPSSVDPLGEVDEEKVSLRLEINELKDRLYESLRAENAARLKLMLVETINDNLKESRRATQVEQASTDQDRAQIRRTAAEGIAAQDAEDADKDTPFEQADRDQDRADARGRASDEIKKQDGEDSR